MGYLDNFAEMVRAGMSDEELENICREPKMIHRGRAPWVCWESEVSSYGKSFRDWLRIPSFVPLYAVSMHGAFSGRIAPNEVDRRAEVYFGWSRKRVEERKALGHGRSYLVTHPWVRYRRKYFAEKSLFGEGAVFFWPHRNHFAVPEFLEQDKLIEELLEIRESFKTLTICLSFHDVAAGVHRELRRYGFPLVSAGKTNNLHFVDRFYTLMRQFEVGYSSVVGSQVFFFIEAGVPHLLTRNKAVYRFSRENKHFESSDEYWKDYWPAEEYGPFRDFEESLRKFSTEIPASQYNFVNMMLAVGDGLSTEAARRILLGEYLRNWLGVGLLLRWFYRKLVKAPEVKE